MASSKVVERWASGFVVLALSMTLAACAAGPRLTPVRESTPGTDVGWAVVPPPKGGPWYVAETPKGTAIYFKKLESPKHTFVATVATQTISNCCATPEELLTHVRKVQAENSKDKRYRFVAQEAEVTSWDGYACVSHRIVAIDQGSPNFPGEALNYLQKGISCLRPGTSGEMIDLTYSERNGPQQGSPELVVEGESFLKGLKRP